MSKSLKIAVGLVLVTTVVACGRPAPEPVYSEPAPIVAEPTYSKY